LEFAVEVAVDDLHEEFAEIGESGCGDGFVGEGIYGVAEHAGGEGAGLDGHFGAGNAAITLTGESVTQSVEKCGRRRYRFAAGRGDEGFAALDAFVERGKEAEETDHPEIEIGDGHPDGGGFKRLEDGPGEAEDGVIGLAVRHEVVEHFGEVGKGDGARVVHGGGERREKHVTGVEAGEFLSLAVLPLGANTGGGFEGSAETLLGALGGLGDALHLAFGAGKESDEQIGLSQRVGAENDGLRLLEGHGGIVEQGFKVSRFHRFQG